MSHAHRDFTFRRAAGLVGAAAAVPLFGPITGVLPSGALTYIQPPFTRGGGTKIWSCRAVNTSATASTLTVYVQDQYTNKFYIAFNQPLAVGSYVELVPNVSFITVGANDSIYALISAAGATADIITSAEIYSP